MLVEFPLSGLASGSSANGRGLRSLETSLDGRLLLVGRVTHQLLDRRRLGSGRKVKPFARNAPVFAS